MVAKKLFKTGILQILSSEFREIFRYNRDGELDIETAWSAWSTMAGHSWDSIYRVVNLRLGLRMANHED